MSKPEEIAAMMDLAQDEFGGVDILVNNAGIQHVAPIEDFPLEKWNAIIAIDLISALDTCRLVNFVAQMYLDDDPPISAGREIWGFPKKYAHPKLEVAKDTLTGTLEYACQLVAMGTMGCKHESMAGNGERTTPMLAKTNVNLKLIPGVDGCPAICQLVGYNLTEIVIKGSWIGPGRLHLVPHVNAPVADLPVRRTVGAHHFLADLTLPYGRVPYDYLGDADACGEAGKTT
jgi:acetoacetate decarboxylase